MPRLFFPRRSKASKCCFGGDDNFMLTTGFSQQAERQIYIWDRRAMEEPKEAIVLDQGSASKCATSD